MGAAAVPPATLVDMTGRGRDRLRELLDAVLADEHEELGAMATSAFATPWHFSRQLRRSAGEPPVALRRRVILERAAWQLRQGTSVTDAAFGAGYESVEGFSRAFARSYGYPPSSVAGPRPGAGVVPRALATGAERDPLPPADAPLGQRARGGSAEHAGGGPAGPARCG